jgi:hypothetical protein
MQENKDFKESHGRVVIVDTYFTILCTSHLNTSDARRLIPVFVTCEIIRPGPNKQMVIQELFYNVTFIQRLGTLLLSPENKKRSSDF